MNKESNLYIEALRYGRQNMKNGITYNQLMKYLGEKQYVFDVTYNEYLHYWFYSNFFHRRITIHLRISNAQTQAAISNMSSCNSDLCILTAEGLELLVDYEKLEEAKKASKKAHNLAFWAIIISCVMAVVQIVLQLMWH